MSPAASVLVLKGILVLAVISMIGAITLQGLGREVPTWLVASISSQLTAILGLLARSPTDNHQHATTVVVSPEAK
jgi:hypothetical protein